MRKSPIANAAAVVVAGVLMLGPSPGHFDCDNAPWARQHPIECGFIVGPGTSQQGCGGLCGVVRSILRHLPLL